MSEEERKDAKVMQKKLQAILLSTPSREPMDPNYRRVLYVRYADDFLIGVIGNKADAEQIKTAVSEFLKQELNLTMSPEKTLITHGHDKARFLGYDITISKNQAVKKTKGGVKRAYNGLRCPPASKGKMDGINCKSIGRLIYKRMARGKKFGCLWQGTACKQRTY